MYTFSQFTSELPSPSLDVTLGDKTWVNTGYWPFLYILKPTGDAIERRRTRRRKQLFEDGVNEEKIQEEEREREREGV